MPTVILEDDGLLMFDKCGAWRVPSFNFSIDPYGWRWFHTVLLLLSVQALAALCGMLLPKLTIWETRYYGTGTALMTGARDWNTKTGRSKTVLLGIHLCMALASLIF